MQVRINVQYLCVSVWIIVSSYASCQELTSTLPEGQSACPGDEIIFTCTVRGLQSLTNLILAWSSSEYIGQGTYLQFTTASDPGSSVTSAINGNVSARLVHNSFNNGVPVMESQLFILVGEVFIPTVMCHSLSNGSSASIDFLIYNPVVPQVPQGVAATELPATRLSSQCALLLHWNSPSNIPESDVDHYVVNIPSLNLTTYTNSTLVTHLIPQCTSNMPISVRAISRCRQVGPDAITSLQLLTVDNNVVTTGEPSENSVQCNCDGPSWFAVGIGYIILAVILAIALSLSIVSLLMVLAMYYGVLPRPKSEQVHYDAKEEPIILTDGDSSVDSQALAIPEEAPEEVHDVDTSRPTKEQLEGLPVPLKIGSITPPSTRRQQYQDVTSVASAAITYPTERS